MGALQRKTIEILFGKSSVKIISGSSLSDILLFEGECELHSTSKSRMSDKLLTEIILSVTLNQINNTQIDSRKQLGSCSALTIVRFNRNKSKMYTPQKAEW